MPSVHLVREEETLPAATTQVKYPWVVWSYLGVGAMLFALIGTWLVWFSASLQWKHQEEEIRAACRRVMPETADRCYDTVIIQRGSSRR